MSNVVDAAICKLRKKINLDGCSNLIQTRRGSGYILEADT
jgi:DNA-binding response OmpR family regulator